MTRTYASEFRRCHLLSYYGDNKLYKIACGFEHDHRMKLNEDCRTLLDGLSIHY